MIISDMNIQHVIDSTTQIEDKKLKKALSGFESMFVLQLLKSMRAAYTSGKDDSGLGKDTFLSLTDQAFADYIGEQGSLGIAKMLYKQFKGSEAAPEKTDNNDMADSGQIPLSLDELMKVARQIPAVQKALEQADNVNGSALKNNFLIKSGGNKAINNIPKMFSNSTVVNGVSNVMRDGIDGRDNISIPDTINTSIDKAADAYRLPRELLKAIIKAESSGNPGAVSPRGAKGLMQLIDSTATEMGVTDQFDPEQNIMGGAKYIRKLLDHFKGDLKLTLAAYNAGPGNVRKFGGIPPFSETRNYVEKVIKYMNDSNFDKDSKLLADKP